MPAKSPLSSRDRIVQAATDLFRRQGYVTTTVDQICAAAGVTKGAFFHHFASKEDLAIACLEAWDAMGAAIEKRSSSDGSDDPLARLRGLMDTFIELFSQPGVVKSCLAGTTLQEVSETHPKIRDAAYACLAQGIDRFKTTLDEACKKHRRRLDTAALASFWMVTLQGSLLLSKGGGDESVIPQSLRHVRKYILSQFDSK